MRQGIEEGDDGKLSRKSKKILNQIYKDQKTRNRASKKKKKYKIDRSSNKGVSLEGYDTVEGEGRFDVKIRKPGVKLEKKHALYEKAYGAMVGAQYEVAIFYYEDILKRYYKDEYALVGLALAYHYLGDIILAKKFYAKAIGLYPNNLVAINNFLILVGRESPEESLAELLKIDRVFYDNHVLKAQIAYLYAQQEQYDDSIKYINMALKFSSHNVRYLYNKAVVLDRQGNYEEAKKLYDKILNGKSINVLGVSADKIRKRLNDIG